MGDRPVGLTKDSGWEIGVSRTFPADARAVWDFLLSPRGAGIWLGDLDAPLSSGEPYATRGGTRGEVRSLRPGDRIRLSWQPRGRDDAAIVQIAIRGTPGGTSVRFHAERLRDASERERMRDHWRAVLDAIGAALAES